MKPAPSLIPLIPQLPPRPLTAKIILQTTLLLPLLLLSQLICECDRLSFVLWNTSKFILRKRTRPYSSIHALAKSPGTIIVEYLGQSHCSVRYWWTPDSIAAEAAKANIAIPVPYLHEEYLVPPPGEPHTEEHLPPRMRFPDFDTWLYKHYIHPTNGTAILLRTTLTINSANRTINQLNTLLADHPTTLEHTDFVFAYVRDRD